MKYLENSGMKKLRLLLILLVLNTFCTSAQNADSVMIKRFFDNALQSDVSYNNLKELCEYAPGRLAGLPAMDSAMKYSLELMKSMPFDTVYIQPCMVRQWLPGEDTSWYSPDGKAKFPLTVDVLGGSVATPENGINAQVVIFNSIEEMKKADPATVKGKIVYFNRPMNQTYYNTFRAYGENASMRVIGADEASKMGAVAVLIRSLCTEIDDFPHTGIMRYKTSEVKIPGFAVSTKDALELDSALVVNPQMKIFLESTCKELPEKEQGNVIGEIRGTVHPERIITVGGHLDSWYNSAGAHDDGGGCMQSLEVARLFFETGYKPQNTLRVVFFIDEEMDQRGGKKYAAEAKAQGEKHVFALESDHGMALPTGFSVDSAVLAKVLLWKDLLEPYGFKEIEKGYGGVDISFLKALGVPLCGLVTDSQRYFEYHHSANDTFDKIVRRELQLGAAGMASLIYLVDKYGVE
ncbi:hypothetical protein SDC9_59705 [bioreactor metagenome]|uniref:Carboxypeptidase Q n=1 Tax=bioreactor metagenome TaxID=1076179 RepID=A0A644XC37_9ZZZZ